MSSGEETIDGVDRRLGWSTAAVAGGRLVITIAPCTDLRIERALSFTFTTAPERRVTFLAPTRSILELFPADLLRTDPDGSVDLSLPWLNKYAATTTRALLIHYSL